MNVAYLSTQCALDFQIIVSLLLPSCTMLWHLYCELLAHRTTIVLEAGVVTCSWTANITSRCYSTLILLASGLAKRWLQDKCWTSSRDKEVGRGQRLGKFGASLRFSNIKNQVKPCCGRIFVKVLQQPCCRASQRPASKQENESIIESITGEQKMKIPH